MVIQRSRVHISGVQHRLALGGLRISRAAIATMPIRGKHPASRVAVGVFGRSISTLDTTIAGYAVQLTIHDDLQRQMAFGILDPVMTRFISDRLRPGDVFYDLGANIGYYSLIAARAVGPQGEVHAFEPIPQNARILDRARTRNNLTQLLVNQVAVGDSPGELTLYVGDVSAHSGWASVVSSPNRQTAIQTPVIAIDDYVNRARRKPDLIKIDIEGAEPEALAGMRRLLESDDAPDLIVEVNSFLLERTGRTPASILGPLVRHGYRWKEIGRDDEAFTSSLQTHSQIGDYFLTKNAPGQANES